MSSTATVGDARPAGALPQRALDARHRLVVAFDQRFDAPVGQVAHPAGHAFAVGGVLGEIAEADTLHAAADEISPGHTHRINRSKVRRRGSGGAGGLPYLMKVNLACAEVPLLNGQRMEPLLGRAVARTVT